MFLRMRSHNGCRKTTSGLLIIYHNGRAESRHAQINFENFVSKSLPCVIHNIIDWDLHRVHAAVTDNCCTTVGAPGSARVNGESYAMEVRVEDKSAADLDCLCCPYRN